MASAYLSPEHLAGLLAGGVQRWSAGGGAERDRWTQADAAAVLAGCARWPAAAWRLVYAGEEGARAAVEDRLWFEAAQLAAAAGWRYGRTPEDRWPGRSQLRTLARMAVRELVRGPGAQAPSGAAMAAELGVDRTNWQRTWRGRYAAILSVATGWLDEAETWIHRRQRAGLDG
jgi:hypothetical protein